MKEITILSGKGGTGKTSITAALASLANNAVYCDNDVDAADLHLIFQPTIEESYLFSSGWKAHINSSKCNDCQLCKDQCRFDAISYVDPYTLVIDPYKCEGCRLCERLCPKEAIHSEENINNHWFVSHSRFGTLVHAEMGPGEENSGKLVTTIRRKARELAQLEQRDYILNDGPPGIGCTTISSLSGTDIVLLVIEASKSGFHDVKRLVELIESFNIKSYAVINKYDLNSNIANEIEAFLKSRDIQLLSKFPFDVQMVEAMVQGKTIMEYSETSEISKALIRVWNQLKSCQPNKIKNALSIDH